MVEAHDTDLQFRLVGRRHLDVPALMLESNDKTQQLFVEVAGLFHLVSANVRKQPRNGGAFSHSSPAWFDQCSTPNGCAQPRSFAAATGAICWAISDSRLIASRALSGFRGGVFGILGILRGGSVSAPTLIPKPASIGELLVRNSENLERTSAAAASPVCLTGLTTFATQRESVAFYFSAASIAALASTRRASVSAGSTDSGAASSHPRVTTTPPLTRRQCTRNRFFRFSAENGSQQQYNCYYDQDCAQCKTDCG